MKLNKALLFFIFLIIESNIAAVAQEGFSENPRGVYKLIDFVGRGGETFEPSEEQYKICTDSVTVTLIVNGDNFDFSLRDGNMVFNYTGEEPDVSNPHASRIYESNAQRFSVKWWSLGYYDRPLFPKADWCIEHYEADKFSEAGRAIIDAFMSANYRDDSNPLIGVWSPVGAVRNIQDAEEVKRVLETSEIVNTNYCILTPSLLLNSADRRGKITHIDIKDKDSLQIGTSIRRITWLSPDTIAIDLQQGHTIWVRVNLGESLFASIASAEPKAIKSMTSKTIIPADPHYDAVKQYLIHVPDVMELLDETAVVLKEKYKKLNKRLEIHALKAFSMTSSMTDGLAFTYSFQQYENDVFSTFVEYVRGRIGLDNLHKLNAMYDTSKAKLACEHLTQLKNKMKKEISADTFVYFKKKGTLPASEEKECSEKFHIAWNSFCKVTDIEGIMMHRLDDLTQSRDISLYKTAVPRLYSIMKEDEKQEKKRNTDVMPEFHAVMKEKLPKLLLNASLDFMTEEDLMTLTAISSSSEGEKMTEISRNFVKEMGSLFNPKEMTEVASMMQEKYRSFLEKNTTVHYIQY